MSTVLRSTTFQLHVKNEDGTTQMKTFTRAVSDADKTVEQLNASLGDNVEVTTKTKRTTHELTQQARLQVTQIEKANRAYKTQVQELTHQISLVGKSAEEQAVLNAQYRLGAEATQEQREEVARLVQEQQRLSVAAGDTTGSMRDFRGIMQNAGWQMQDTVVQLQMGTDAMIVMSQQGSQMAAAFGPTGAIVGAFIAVAGAVALVAGASYEAEEALDDLENKIYDLTKAQRAVALTALIDEQKDLKEELKDSSLQLKNWKTQAEDAYLSEESRAKAAKKVDEYAASIDELNKSLEENAYRQKIVKGETPVGEFDFADTSLNAMNTYLDRMEEIAVAEDRGIITNKEAARERTLALQTYDEAISTLEVVTEKTKKVSEADEDLTRTIMAQIAIWKERTKALSRNERQQALYEARAESGIEVSKTELDILQKSIDAYYDEVDAIKAAEEAEKARQKAILDQIKLTEKLEAQRVKQREALLKPIETGINASINMDATRAEEDLYKQNMDILKAQLGATLDWEYSERARINLLIEAEQQRHSTAMKDIAQAQLVATLQTNATYLSELGGIMGQLESLAEEGTAEAEALFLANRAIAFANTIVQANLAAESAGAWGAAMGPFGYFTNKELVRASGYASAGIIAGTTLAGAFDKGGYIPSNQMGIVSEYGDELVNGVLVKGPARVTSREETAEMMNGGGKGGGITVIQHITVSGNGDKALKSAMEQAARKGAQDGANMAYSKVSSDFSTGRGIRAQLRKSIGV